MKFGLPEDEVVIKSYSCKHSSVSGLVYISQHFVCFYGSVFGLSKQVRLPLYLLFLSSHLSPTLHTLRFNGKLMVIIFTESFPFHGYNSGGKSGEESGAQQSKQQKSCTKGLT